MKGKIILFILSFYLLASTEFHQVLKLPLLVKHYSEHQAQVNDLTFWEFLVMHYETDVAHDDQDMDLPFKDCQHSLTSQSVAIHSPKITITAPLPVLTEPELPLNNATFQSSHLEEIFQPPKG